MNVQELETKVELLEDRLDSCEGEIAKLREFQALAERVVTELRDVKARAEEALRNTLPPVSEVIVISGEKPQLTEEQLRWRENAEKERSRTYAESERDPAEYLARPMPSYPHE